MLDAPLPADLCAFGDVCAFYPGLAQVDPVALGGLLLLSAILLLPLMRRRGARRA